MLNDGWQVTRIEFADGGAATLFKWIGEPESGPAESRGGRRLSSVTASELGRLEAEVPTRQEAEDIVTEWDREWGTNNGVA